MSSECLKKGYLLKCPQKAMNPFKKWKSRWFVLYGNSSRGRVRLEYYDSDKSWQQEKGKRCIPLPHCVSVKPVWNKDYNHVIEIVSQDKTYYLAAGSKDEEKSWFRNLCKAVFGSPNRNSIVHVVDRARPDPIDLGYHSLDRSIGEASEVVSQGSPSSIRRRADSSDQLSTLSRSREKLTGACGGGSTEDVVESNLPSLSKSSQGKGINSELSSLISFESGFDDTSSLASSIVEGICSYPVTVRPTIASQKAGLAGTYILQISQHILQLVDIPTQTAVAEWPIQFLRRYGRGRTKFSFEANEKCKLGKGVYTFNTLEGDSIFHQVDMYARKISSHQKQETREKRVSLPEQGFRPLDASAKKWHHSDGKLSEIGDLVPLATNEIGSDLDVSLDNVAVTSLGQGAISQGKGRLPSKSRVSSGLEVITDSESKTKIESETKDVDEEIKNSSINAEPPGIEISAKQGTNLGESTENFQTNPALVDEGAPLKVDEEVSMSIKETVQDIQEFTSNTQERIYDVTVYNDVFINEPIPTAPRDSVKLNSEKKGTVTSDFSSLKPIKIEIEVDEHSDDYANEQTNGNSSSLKPQEHENVVESKPESKLETLTVSTVTEAKQEKKSKTESERKETEAPDERESAKSRLERVFEKTFGPRKKNRQPPLRQKSFELPSRHEEKQNYKMSGSFSAFDHTGQPVEMKTRKSDGEPRRLHRRYLSVLKRIEMFEQLEKNAEENRKNSYTVWRRKSVR